MRYNEGGRAAAFRLVTGCECVPDTYTGVWYTDDSSLQGMVPVASVETATGFPISRGGLRPVRRSPDTSPAGRCW